jgi:hypothetical protein
MNHYMDMVPGLAEYYKTERCMKTGISEEMFVLSASAAGTPPYGLKGKGKLSESGIVAMLMVPNENLFDIDEARFDDAQEKPVPVKDYLQSIYLKFAKSIYTEAAQTGGSAAAGPQILKDDKILEELTLAQRTSVVTMMRYTFIAYAMVTPPNAPTFPMFLLYKGNTKKGGNNDVHNLDNYEPVSLDALQYFHLPDTAERCMKSPVSTITMVEHVLTREDGEEIKVKYPEYDPRIGVQRFRHLQPGRDLVKIVDPSRAERRAAKKKTPKKADGSKTPDADKDEKKADDEGDDDEEEQDEEEQEEQRQEEEAAEEKEEKEEEEKRDENDEEKEKKKKKKKKKNQEQKEKEKKKDEKKAKKKHEKKEKKKDEDEANSGDEDAEAVVDKMEVDEEKKPAELPSALYVSDGDLEILGVKPLQHHDLSTNCVWIDRAGNTGHVATPTVEELNSYNGLIYNLTRGTEGECPGNLAVRMLLTIAGRHNPGVALQPFINTATKGLVETPILGSMDINQLGSVLSADVTNAIKDHVIRTALTDETLRLAYVQYVNAATTK